MKLWFVVGAFAAAAFPMAAAAERTETCEDARGGATERAEPTMAQQPVAAPRPSVAQRDDAEQRTTMNARRRSGKRVPDAELIGPRGAL